MSVGSLAFNLSVLAALLVVIGLIAYVVGFDRSLPPTNEPQHTGLQLGISFAMMLYSCYTAAVTGLLAEDKAT